MREQAHRIRLCVIAGLVATVIGAGIDVAAQSQKFGVVIHGGAGTITRAKLTPEQEKDYRAKLAEALDAAWSILDEGGSSMDAVIEAVVIMEDSPLFNAGAGSVYTADGTHELDASVMDGASGNAGAVAAVRHVKNPVKLAREVMERSRHVMLMGDGAEAFARKVDAEMVDNSYFNSAFRLRQLEQAQEKEDLGTHVKPMDVESKFGTVGAVALDRAGNLAAATSTGGTTNKRYGRVGDSPIIGAGTYADNETCAVSATGHGEYFIRNVVAYDVCAQMHYTGITLAESADNVVLDKLEKVGGDGGIIAIDREGNVAMPFNTEGMYRGYRIGDAEGVVDIYGEDE